MCESVSVFDVRSPVRIASRLVVESTTVVAGLNLNFLVVVSGCQLLLFASRCFFELEIESQRSRTV